MKKAFYTLILIFTFCFTLTGCSFLDFGNDSNYNNNNDNNSSDNTDNKTSTNYQYYNLTETFTYDELSITIKDFYFQYYIVGGSYYAGDGNVWLVVDVQIDNNTTKTKYLKESSLFGSYRKYLTKIIYTNENGEEADYFSSYTYDSAFIVMYDEILAYGSISGIYAYVMPKALISKLVDNLERDLRNRHTEPLNNGLSFQFALNDADTTNFARVYL